MNLDIVLQLILATWLWALVWMERWVKTSWKLLSKENITFWWIRTFALIWFMWALSTWLSWIYNDNIFIVISFLLIWLFIWIYYFYTSFKEKQYWLTSEIAALITFLLWVFVMSWWYQIAIILSIILTFVLSSKTFLEELLSKISKEWFHNTLKFAMISIVILPLLPDYKYSIAEILWLLGYTNEINNSILTLSFFNPYWLWFFVVLMAWISYLWYILSKVIWEKWSIVASWAIWWLISSTAVTASMTELSKKDKTNTDLYVVSTLIASTIMFIRVIIIVLFFNINMLSTILLPSILMLVWMVIYMVYFYLKSRKKDVSVNTVSFEEKKFSSPFSIWPALKFAWFVLIIKFIAWVGWLYKDVWWDYFFYALWVISWLADVDAISQTMAVDSIDWKIWLEIAAITIIIAIISNNFVKWSIAYKFWEKRFWISVMLWFVVSMIMWIIWMLLLKII